MTRRGLLAGVLLLAACRTDVFVPPEPETTDPDEPTLSGGILDVPAWDPVVRVIDANGELVEDAQVEVSNRDYYRNLPELQPFEATRRQSVYFLSSDPPTDRVIHPPLALEVDLGPGTFPWLDHGLVPAPDDTVLVDFRRASHTLRLDYEVSPLWGAPDVVVRSSFSLSVPPLLESDLVYSYAQRLEDVEPGEYPLHFGAVTRRVDRVEFSWPSVGEGPLVAGEARRISAGYTFLGVVSDIAAVETIEVATETRSIQVEIVAGSAALDAVAVVLRVERNENDSSWYVTGETIASEVPVSFHAFEGEATLTIRGTTDRLPFFERAVRIAMEEGDLVTVDVGTHRLRAQVVDAVGAPVADVPVVFRRAHAEPWREPIRLTTDATGVAEIRVMDGFYEIEFGVDLASPIGSRIVAVREDTEVEFTWDR